MILTVIIALVMTVWLIFQDSWVQSFAARIAAYELSRSLGTTIRIGTLSVSFRNGIQLEEILVKDNRDTTLFSAKLLALKPLWISRSNRLLQVSAIRIHEGEFQLLQYKGDSTLNLEFIINHFASPDTIPTPPDTTPSAPWTITCEQVDLQGIRFHYQDFNNSMDGPGMDYANIDVREINLDIRDVRIEGDTINASIRSLTAVERSGIRIHRFDGECRVSSRFIRVDDLDILTDHSTLSLDLSFTYLSYRAFTDFLKRVSLNAVIRPSTLDMTDIGFFAPEISDMTNLFRISGTLAGTVSKFRATGFRVGFGEHTLFDGDLYAVGLPEITATFVDLTIRRLTTTSGDLATFRLPGTEGGLALPGLIANLGQVSIRGDFSGFYNDFIARVQLSTAIGNATTNLSLKKDEGESLYAYKGSLAIQSFDLGRFIGEQELLGRVSLTASLDGQGFGFGDADLLMQIMVDSILVNNYNYSNISINGSFYHGKFFGDFGVNDPNLQLAFHGMANFQDSIPDFHFTANLGLAQLYDLHLMERDTVMLLSLGIQADFTGNTIDNLNGNIMLENLTYQEGEQHLFLDSVVIQTDMDTLSGYKKYVIRSQAVDAEFSGAFAFSELFPSLDIFIQNYLADFSMQGDSVLQENIGTQELRYSIRFKDTRDITDIFLPFLSISPGSFLKGIYNQEQQLLSLTGESEILRLAGIDLLNWKFEAETRTNNLSLQTGCTELIWNKSDKNDTVYIQADTLLLTADLRHDSILYKLSSTTDAEYSYLKGYLAFLADNKIKISLNEMEVFLPDHVWTISPENYIMLDSSSIEIHHVNFMGNDQLLSINGRLTHNREDTLDLSFSNLNVSEVDYFLENPDIDIDGVLSGSLKFTDVYNELSLFSDLTLKNFTFNKQLLGDGVFQVDYNYQDDRFDVLAEIIYTGNIGQNIPFSLVGSYYSVDTTDRLDFDLKLKNLNLKMLYPFVSDFMSKLTGLASGEVKITGTTKKPSLEGELNLMRTEFNISYLNVPYSLSDVVTIKPDKFLFDNILLYDSLGNKAHLNGSINHDYFSKIFLDMLITMDDFSAFRNTYAQNSTFYGHARATGSVGIRGPLNNIKITVDASTGSHTSVSIPISLTQSVGQIDYIIFLPPDGDTTRTGEPKQRSREATGLTLDMRLNVRRDAQVEVIFPDRLGNIKATGSGNLRMGMTSTTPFTLNGSYTIDKGSFLFQMKNLIRMPFSIKEGSSISWTGDPADATISLSAIYKTKVPLTGLTTETEVMAGRIPVECIIRLNGKLLNPMLSFGLELPNAPEQARTIVYNSIDTNNTAEMTQQVLYILVMNQFKPMVAGSDPTVDVGATSLSIVTNQINTWLAGMSQNLNIGVNYKPGSATAGQEIDMTVSTQFFNDRLLIDGTFGMSSYRNPSSSQASTIVGDINIEYLLTKNRRWRLRAFNRTNTIDILYNNSPYTQGVGISYQREFARWGDLFKGTKKK